MKAPELAAAIDPARRVPGPERRPAAAIRDLALQARGTTASRYPTCSSARRRPTPGSAVVHCDAHFDRIAAILGFESRWLVPPSSG